METINKAGRYRSYFEVAQKIKNPEARLAFYDAVDFYTFEGIEPENLPLEADIAFTAIRANIDADLKRKTGGAPQGNQNARKNNSKQPIETTENNLKQPSCFEKTNNEDVNEDEEEEVNTQKEGACEPLIFGKLQKDCWELVQNHNKDAPKERKIPCSNNFITFTQREMRELLEAAGTEEPPYKIFNALTNYIKVAKSDTWQKTFTWRSFCKNYQSFSPDFFTLAKYLNTIPETDDATQKPEYKFYMRMKTESRFHVETFQAHIEDWKAEGRPEGAEYYRLQDEWEAEKCY